MTTPAQLRKARKGAGLTLAQAADATGLSVTYLCQMETGARPVTQRATKAYKLLERGVPVGALSPRKAKARA